MQTQACRSGLEHAVEALGTALVQDAVTLARARGIPWLRPAKLVDDDFDQPPQFTSVHAALSSVPRTRNP
jgi:hypothetical protein